MSLRQAMALASKAAKDGNFMAQVSALPQPRARKPLHVPRQRSLFGDMRQVFSMRFAKDLYAEVMDDNILTGAAGLSYFTILAFFPALIALLSLIPFLPIENLHGEVMAFLRDALPGDAFGVVSTTISEIVSQEKGGVLTFGILFSLWSASSGITAVIQQLNITYDVEETRPFWRVRLNALALTVSLGLLMIVSFALIVIGGNIQNWVVQSLGLGAFAEDLLLALRWVIIISFLMMAFAVTYYFGPDVKQKFRFITPGSVLGVVCLIAASLAFRFYVSRFGNYQAVYGSIGAVIILLLWLYIAGAILLFGSEINALIEHYSSDGKDKGEKAA